MAEMNLLKIGLLLNNLAMMMDDETLKKCKSTIDEIESELLKAQEENDG